MYARISKPFHSTLQTRNNCYQRVRDSPTSCPRGTSCRCAFTSAAVVNNGGPNVAADARDERQKSIREKWQQWWAVIPPASEQQNTTTVIQALQELSKLIAPRDAVWVGVALVFLVCSVQCYHKHAIIKCRKTKQRPNIVQL